MINRKRRKTRVPLRAHLLASLVVEHDWRLGVELGVLNGRTFLYLLKTCPALHMVGVDIWQTWPDKEAFRERGGRSYSSVDMEGTYIALKNKIALYGSRARLLRMKTADAAGHYGDKAFDFVFIDADHTYEGVRADIDAWLSKIRPGGWLMGHDFNPRDFPGVVQAVTETFGEPRTYEDHVWAVTV